jgi:ketosteroid isomerase-like protein
VSADVSLEVIEAVYEAFGRGDVAAITAAVTDDVDWASDTSSTAAPWYGPHRGKAGVQAFFQEFGGAMDVTEFEPISFAANDTEVNTVVRIGATRRSNGRSISMNLHHHFVLCDGLITYYRGSEDSAQTEAVFRD